MKFRRHTLLASFAAAGIIASASFAQAQARVRVERRAAAAACPPTCSYSVEVPLVQHYTPPGNGQSGTLVLNSAHSFNVTLIATNQHNGNVQGAGVALPQTDVFGYFSFPSITNDPTNPEVFVKILDARTVNGNFWVFFGHLTDLIYDLTVTENATGRTKTYHKDAGVTPGGAFTTDFPSSATVTTDTENTPAAAATPNAFVRTSVDVSNNTSATILANLQYAYVCTAPTCSPVGEFNRTRSDFTISIPGRQTFHQDDVVQYLSTQVLLKPGADQGSTGTLLVTFSNLPSNVGWEGTVQARNYNRVSEVDSLRGTVGLGENGSLFYQSNTTRLVGTAVDTRSAPTPAGSLTSHVGIINSDIFQTGDANPVAVDLSLVDSLTGLAVGNTVTLTNIRPGELRLVTDLFTAAAVPASVHSVILFATTHNPASAPTIEGFILTQDTNSLDTRFSELQCADPAGLCGFF
jgi:hypothetical protein